MSIQAIKDIVIFVEDEVELVTEAGIVLPVQTNDFTMGSIQRINKEENQTGTIVSVGDKVQDLKPGDKIMPLWREVGYFTFEDKRYCVVEEKHILGVFEEKD